MTPDPWDEAEHMLVDARRAWQARFEALPDDLAHFVARNRIEILLGHLVDAGMCGMYARQLVAEIQGVSEDRR